METDRFNDALRTAVIKAISTARSLNDAEIKPEYVFEHVLGEDQRSPLWFFLHRSRKEPLLVQQKLQDRQQRRKKAPNREPSATRNLNNILSIARRITEKRKESLIGSKAFLKACILQGKNVPFAVLKEVGLTSDDFAHLLIKY